MASKARELAELIGNAGGTSEQVLSGRRNLIINGAMQVAQRGTSISYLSAVNKYTLDRHKLSVYNTGFTTPTDGGTVSQVVLSDSQSEAIGFSHAFRFSPTTQAKLVYHSQFVEGMLKETANKTVVLSFYARVNTGTLTLTNQCRMSQNFGSGGSSAVNFFTDYSDVVITSEWKRIKATFNVPSVVGKTLGTGHNLEARLFQAQDFSSLSGGYLEVTGVQLELGSVATPFEHRSYGEELALCQRYYQKYTRRGAIYAPISSNSNYNTWFGTFSVPMRTAPTFVELAGDSWTYYGDTNSFEFYRFPVGNYLPPAWSADAEL